MAKDTKKEIHEKRAYPILKSNEMVQHARYGLTLKETKVLAYIFSKVKPGDKLKQWYVFNMTEYLQVCGMFEGGDNYKNTKKSLQAIRNKSFWMLDKSGKETTVGWLEKVEVSKRSGKVAVRLDEDLHKYLIGLKNNYTYYELLSVLPMRSVYSVRLYELLKSSAFTKGHTFKREELEYHLDATHYSDNWKDFRRRCLEPAVEEINAYTDLDVKWEPGNKGRKVIEVHFTIREKDVVEKLISGNYAHEVLDGQMSLMDFMNNPSDQEDEWQDIDDEDEDNTSSLLKK